MNKKQKAKIKKVNNYLTRYVLPIMGVFVLAILILIAQRSMGVVPATSAHPTITVQPKYILVTATKFPTATQVFKSPTPGKFQFLLPTPTLPFQINVWETWDGKVIWAKTLTIRPQPYASGEVGRAAPNSIWEFDAYQIIEWRDVNGNLLYQDTWWRLTAQNGWLPEVLNGTRYLEAIE